MPFLSYIVAVIGDEGLGRERLDELDVSVRLELLPEVDSGRNGVDRGRNGSSFKALLVFSTPPLYFSYKTRLALSTRPK